MQTRAHAHTYWIPASTDQVIALLYSEIGPVALDDGREAGLRDGAEAGREMAKDKNTSEENTRPLTVISSVLVGVFFSLDQSS